MERSIGANNQLVGEEGLMTDVSSIRTFILAGNARATLRSLKTGTRFTYRIKLAPKRETRAGKGRPWFVSVLTGSDNDESYQYMGNLWMSGSQLSYQQGGRSRITKVAPSSKAWTYFVQEVLYAGRLPNVLQVWHEGKCGRCGRALTVPESIRSGLGPECRGKEQQWTS